MSKRGVGANQLRRGRTTWWPLQSRLVLLLAVVPALASCRSDPAQPSIDVEIVRTLVPDLGGVELADAQALDVRQRQTMAAEGDLGFRFEHDFDGNGLPELALLGRSRRADETSTFVLLAEPHSGGWARAGLLTFDKDFIVGRISNGTLLVFFCIGCDDGGMIEWTGSEYAYRPFPAAGVPE